MIGPNGAGKSTTFNIIAGTYAADEGEIRFDGESIAGMPPHQIARRGVMRTFQHNRPFEGMSVLENVLVGAHTRFGRNLFRARLPRRGARTARAGRTPGGIRRPRRSAPRTWTGSPSGKGVCSRSLARSPERRLILFDEPAAGLTRAEAERIATVIRGIAERGIAVLLIEHDMHFLLPLAHRVVVLNFGAKIAEGTPDEVRSHPAVLDAYLGHAAAV